MRVIRRGASFMLTDVLLGGGIRWHPALRARIAAETGPMRFFCRVVLYTQAEGRVGNFTVS